MIRVELEDLESNEQVTTLVTTEEYYSQDESGKDVEISKVVILLTFPSGLCVKSYDTHAFIYRTALPGAYAVVCKHLGELGIPYQDLES